MTLPQDLPSAFSGVAAGTGAGSEEALATAAAGAGAGGGSGVGAASAAGFGLAVGAFAGWLSEVLESAAVEASSVFRLGARERLGGGGGRSSFAATI